MLTKKNEKLLKKCLDHWYENLMMLQLNFLSDHEFLDENISIKGRDCAFCNAYHQVHTPNGKIGCVGCPIMEKTGNGACCDTPYGDVSDAFALKVSYEDMFKAITDEINFLESLKD